MVVPSAVLPQRQPCSDVPPPAAVSAAVALAMGVKVNTLVVPRPAMLFWSAMMVILPSASAEPEVTDLLGLTEQAAGNAVAGIVACDVWTASEIPVRQADAASTTSETLARTV